MLFKVCTCSNKIKKLITYAGLIKITNRKQKFNRKFKQYIDNNFTKSGLFY